MSKEHIERIEKARLKYKPDEIKCLFIAEAPPSDEDRFFYFEEVWEQDSLYIEMMNVLFDESADSEKSELFGELFGHRIPTAKLRKEKKQYLEKFRKKGYYLIDSIDYPIPPDISRTKDKINYLEQRKDELAEKVKGLVKTNIPIVLISVPVHSAMAGTLKYYGFRVINEEPIPFPGSGQQKNFHEKMNKLKERYKL
jgi:hypothetical protein